MLLYMQLFHVRPRILSHCEFRKMFKNSLEDTKDVQLERLKMYYLSIDVVFFLILSPFFYPLSSKIFYPISSKINNMSALFRRFKRGS